MDPIRFLVTHRICVSQAICSTNFFKQEINFSEMETSFVNESIYRKHQTIHPSSWCVKKVEKQVTISRNFKRILSISFRSFYACIYRFIPTSLINFVAQLINHNFHIKNDYWYFTQSDTVRKCIDLTECVISLHIKPLHPFQFSCIMNMVRNLFKKLYIYMAFTRRTLSLGIFRTYFFNQRRNMLYTCIRHMQCY